MNKLYRRDIKLPRSAFRLIGVDEAGRGALAGPVVVAAVILDYRVVIDEINDSKQLLPAKREELFTRITETALAYHICEIGVDYIDQFNILQATLKGMRDSASAIAGSSDLCLIDGNQIPPGIPCETRAVVRGDNLHACIAAASILAKVHRDRLMTQHCSQYPLYGFSRHKGYGTPLHLAALHEHGPCPLHRMSFSPISQLQIPI